MRNGIDGLRAIVEAALKKDAYQGHLFVFVGKAKDKVKILFWDRNGFVIYLKRLERGRFQLPAVDARTKHVAMEPAQLAMLLDGIDLNVRRLARWDPGDKGIDTDRRSRVAPGIAPRGSHRSGRARFTHPALRFTGSLHAGGAGA